MRRLILIMGLCLGVTPASRGSDFGPSVRIESRDLANAADALDRFSNQIEKTTHPEKGHLKKLIDDTARELRELIKEAEVSGKAITADFMLKWAAERKETLDQIRVLASRLFGDAHVLVREFQAAGVCVPRQLGDELMAFRKELGADVARILVTSPLGPDRKTLAGYSGLTWTERPAGFYEVSFVIKDAPTLHLSVGGGEPIPPAKAPVGGATVFRVPITPGIRGRFDDRLEMVLGFALVDADAKRPATEWPVRYTGWMQLMPRFPIGYSFRVVTPGAGPEGEARAVDRGPAIEGLVNSVAGSGVSLAERHGAIYRATETHLPVGASRVVIPRQATWSLTVTFPDGKSEVMTGGKPRVGNPFGRVTVTPTLTDEAWTLLIDVDPN